MPAYIAHAIMGEQLYSKALEEETILKLPISKEELRGYSLGIDLSYLSKKTISDPHNTHTKDFFINMIQYIKENKLVENSHIMALLYGHIAHYFLDTTTHPYIYYIERGCAQVGRITNHDLVEGYLSAYLSEKILGKNIMEIKSDYFNQINLSDKEISNLLNTIYGKIYKDDNIIKSAKKYIYIFNILEKIIKSGLITEEFLIKISKFEQFLKINDLTINELTNENHENFTNPRTKEVQHDSFLDLYNKSLNMSLEALDEVNKYLYSGEPISILDKVFEDLSYDTGRQCSLGKKLIYVRKNR